MIFLKNLHFFTIQNLHFEKFALYDNEIIKMACPISRVTSVNFIERAWLVCGCVYSK